MKHLPVSKSMLENCEDPWDARFIDEVWEQDQDQVCDLMDLGVGLRIYPLFRLGCEKLNSIFPLHGKINVTRSE